MKQVTQNLTPNTIRNTLKTRTIEFNQEFTREYICNVIELMNKIKRYDEIKHTESDKKVIKFNIYSYGGDCHSLLKLLDVIDIFINDYGYEIITHTESFSASCSFVLSVSGTKRTCTSRSIFLNHQISFGAYGTMVDVKNSTEHAQIIEDIIQDHIMYNTLMTQEELDKPKNMNKDIFYTAEQALKFGIVDEIV